MPSFEIQSNLRVDAEQAAEDMLTMTGVNKELYPLLRMSAPKDWYMKPIKKWPVNSKLFNSCISLLGFIPIDIHQFNFIEVNTMGFKEKSGSMMNSEWCHQRTIISVEGGVTVKDKVEYESKVTFLGGLMKPIYRFVFVHRHNKLKSIYGTI